MGRKTFRTGDLVQPRFVKDAFDGDRGVFLLASPAGDAFGRRGVFTFGMFLMQAPVSVNRGMWESYCYVLDSITQCTGWCQTSLIKRIDK